MAPRPKPPRRSRTRQQRQQTTPKPPQYTREQLYFLSAIVQTHGKMLHTSRDPVVFDSKDQQVVEFLVSNFGGSISTKPARRNKTIYCWNLSPEDRLRLLEVLESHFDFDLDGAFPLLVMNVYTRDVFRERMRFLTNTPPEPEEDE